MKTLAASILLTLLMATASCKRSEAPGNNNTGTGGISSADGTSSIPLFATKEPERYRAIRVISVTGGEGLMGGTKPSETFIARDGDRRREDYESAGEKISYLQLPEADFVLFPAKKLYAEVKPGADVSEGQLTVPPDFSPDKLLNEARPEARYERLGPENVNGRATVKYRVSVMNKAAAGGQVTTESIVWVDEILGMPVKSETTSTGGAASGARVTMELRDIQQAVDSALFQVPSDYRRVDVRELFGQLNRGSSSGR